MKTQRTLAWKNAGGTAARVCDMTDIELRICRQRLISQLAMFRLTTGEHSLSQLTLEYLEAEMTDRGLDDDNFN